MFCLCSLARPSKRRVSGTYRTTIHPSPVLRLGSVYLLPRPREAQRPREGHSLPKNPLPSLESLKCYIWPPTSACLPPPWLTSVLLSTLHSGNMGQHLLTKPGARASGRKNTRPSCLAQSQPYSSLLPTVQIRIQGCGEDAPSSHLAGRESPKCSTAQN